MLKGLRVLGIVAFLLCLGWNANAQSEEEVYMFVEDQPSFPGGEDEMRKFISRNVEYPKEARESGIVGTVYIQFIVEKDGTLTNIKVIRGVHESLNQEALRVIKLMPKWKPGKQRGKAVRTQFTIPLKFSLNGGGSFKELKPKRWWQFWK